MGLLARLRAAGLPFDELLRALAYLGDTLPPARLALDWLLSAQRPLPQWAIDSVLLNVDLIPCLFATLEAEDSATACVCHAWRQGWIATEKQRRTLRAGRQLRFDDGVLRNRMLSHHPPLFASHPSGEFLGYGRNGLGFVRLVDKTMRSVENIAMNAGLHGRVSGVTISDDRIFITTRRRTWLLSFDAQPPFTKLHERESTVGCLDYPGVGPNRLVYAFASDDIDTGGNEIHAFDPDSLELRMSFGNEVFKGNAFRNAFGLAFVGDELYAGDAFDFCLHVFSLEGQHLRDVRGDWREPRGIVHVDGRLYLHEREEKEREEEEGRSKTNRAAGKRIYVLTPEGQTLQVWRTPDEAVVRCMGRFGKHELYVDSASEMFTLVGI